MAFERNTAPHRHTAAAARAYTHTHTHTHTHVSCKDTPYPDQTRPPPLKSRHFLPLFPPLLESLCFTSTVLSGLLPMQPQKPVAHTHTHKHTNRHKRPFLSLTPLLSFVRLSVEPIICCRKSLFSSSTPQCSRVPFFARVSAQKGGSVLLSLARSHPTHHTTPPHTRTHVSAGSTTPATTHGPSFAATGNANYPNITSAYYIF